MGLEQIMLDQTKNSNLGRARNKKNDEFYTRLSDIENELRFYKDHFKGKVVYCNCDDPRKGGFFHYFSHNFDHLGLKKLITTCYKNKNIDLFSRSDSEQAISLEYCGDKNGNRVPDLEEIGIKHLKGDGDFRSEECIDLLKQADIVVTNPPFSLFREYISQLIKYDKKFLVIGNDNAITYKEIFPLIKENKIWLGNTRVKEFLQPDKTYKKFGNVGWFTNLSHEKRNQNLILYKNYNPNNYPNYDNYDAIEVGAVNDIPLDYDGAMGVPITFIDKYNPDQFEILGITDRDNNSGLKLKEYTANDASNHSDLNRRGSIKHGDKYVSTYARILIKKRVQSHEN